jgi:hypothetical protein
VLPAAGAGKPVGAQEAAGVMACRTIYIDGVAIGIGCDRTRRPSHKCSSCGWGGADKQCDYPVKTKSGTCDRWLCRKCAVSVGPDRDYCPPHHRLNQEAKTP